MKTIATILLSIAGISIFALAPLQADTRGKCQDKARAKQTESLKTCKQQSGQQKKDCDKKTRDIFKKEFAACK